MSEADQRPRPQAARDVVATFPCTQTQLRCWFLDQLNPGNPALNVAVRWEIRGAFKTASIEAAFRQVIARHEILRTFFSETDGQPQQQVVEAVDFKMPVIDLRHVPEDQRDARIQSISKETAAAPFDLAEPGLFRVTFLMVENQRGFILITAHQSCFDGWSIRVLGREVGEIAAAIDGQRTPGLAELALQYGDFALWQDAYRNSYGFETEKAYWRAQLAGAPYFEVEPDRPRGRTKTSHGEILSAVMPLSFSERIDAAARAHQVSLFSYGAAVISAALHRYCARREVLFGTQIAGREDVDLESLIGVFINNLVLRFDFPESLTFTEHLRRVSATVADALNHQRMPFNNLVELVNPARDPSRNPLVSVNFNQQKAFLENAHYGGFELISAPSQSPGVIYDLNFIMIGRPDGWRMSVEYNTDLFDARTAQELLDLWRSAYAFALDNPDAPLASMQGPVRTPAAPATGGPSTSRLEALLAAHKDVAEVALQLPAAGGNPYAFVTPAPIHAGPLETLPMRLTSYLSGHLSPADMPSGISVMLSLPTAGPASAPAALPAPRPAEAKTDLPHSSPERESQLGRIWADVLGVDTVHSDDDFFALGGHSLLALRMLSAVRATFGVKPELALLFKAPTLAGFARALFGEAPQPPEETPFRTAASGAVTGPVVPAVPEAPQPTWDVSVYQEGDGSCALYTLNHPFLYYRLARLLPPEVSAVNLSMFNASIDAARRQLSLEQIAGEAISAMKLGPAPQSIALIGLCVNGVLAMEMTRQLHCLGHRIQFVALIDSWAPGYVGSQSRLTRLRWTMEKRVKRLAYFTGKLLRGRMRLITYLKEFNVTLKLVERFRGGNAMDAEEQANADVTEFLVAAARRYRPRPISAETVLFFRSQANHRRANDLLFGWRGFVPEDAPVFDVAGWHEDSLTQAGIEHLSGVLSDRLHAGALLDQ
ncbi:condensation domain-containing protein [Nitratireductor pacificus]|uniref:Condensation domain-containing protein n=1 Tax=Nitratireductor pacificus pht-3B TaxID=391937 RepID=K2MCD2_9HYPH|nr:condensation domain-containing protein [Nitratireductor pacificus]EKF18445.1 condensation domain-containing protein [Nitratireductor pacificus pht-3B]